MGNEQVEIRKSKLTEIRELGHDPYGGIKEDLLLIKDVVSRGVNEEDEIKTAGRIISMRGHGKAAFFDISDFSGKIQVYVKKDIIGDEEFVLFKKLDIGDLIFLRGTTATTKTGELTIFTKHLEILSKSLRPLPEKWHGLKDVEIRYRRRYLDLITNRPSLDKFIKRSNIINRIRSYLNNDGFFEVETPMMHPIPGGATARPFITHHNALDMKLYLRIAPELYLKRLLVGGLNKIYEINRNFRNEGISTKHNPEFTMIEIYQAYGNYKTMMNLTEGLITTLVKEIVSEDMKIQFNQSEFDLTPPWQRTPYKELFKTYTGLDWEDKQGISDKCKDLGIFTAKKNADALSNDLFEKLVEPELKGPIFVLDYPLSICPLTKASKTDPTIAERFELFINGMEIANAFTELNDPEEQLIRFESQLKNKDEGMEKLDTDFIMALEYGMPPAGGLGIGIDRLIMLLTDSPSIRDVILFPLLKKEE